MNELVASLWLSLRVAAAATLAVCVTGIPLAWVMARRRFVGRSVIETLITVPLVLPPTVVGYFIIVLLGARGVVGQHLWNGLGYSIMFRFEGAVLAAAVVALPMLYMPAKAAFAAVDPELEDLAKLMGAGRVRMFLQVSLPMAGRGIAAGLLLAFARALGEFGATMMVLGWQPGRQTLPISIYAAFEQGELTRAAPAVALLVLLSLLLIGVYNASGAAGVARR